MKKNVIDYNNPVLEVQDLRQHFKVGAGSRKMVIKAVDGISFNVYKREVFGLVGESGCGKTTTGRTIIKIYNPTDGIIKYNGRIVGAGLQGHKYRIRKAKEQCEIETLQYKPLEKKIYEINETYNKKILELENEINVLNKEVSSETIRLTSVISQYNEKEALVLHKNEAKVSELSREKNLELDRTKNNDIKKLCNLHNKTIGLINSKYKEQIKFIKTIPASEDEIQVKLDEVDSAYKENIQLAKERFINNVKQLDESLVNEYSDQLSLSDKVRFNSKIKKNSEEVLLKIQTIEEKYQKLFADQHNEFAKELESVRSTKPNFEEVNQKLHEIKSINAEKISVLREKIKELQLSKKAEISEAKKHAKENPSLCQNNELEIAKIEARYAEIIAREKELLKEHRYYNKLKETPAEKAERLAKLAKLKEDFNEKIKTLSLEDIEHEKMVYRAEVDKINKAIPNYKNTMSSMQMVFQDPISSLNPRMVVSDIISEGLIIRGERDKELIKQKVNKILEVVGLSPDHATRYPHEFSGGQRQRIGIARALIVEPDFIIADEPISALDVSIQAQIINLLNDLKDELGLTILFVAHDLSVVKYFCDRIAVMYYGKIVEMASSEELFANPVHPYTKSLLSAIPQPDPKFEEIRSRVAYNPSIHNYLHDKPELVEIKPGHFVYCNKEELVKYKAELGLK